MIDLRQLPPSEHADAKASALATQKEIEANRTAAMREDFGLTFQTEHGKRVLAYIFERSGYGKSKVALGANRTVDKDMTTFLAQEEAFYIDIRKYISIEVLAQVEYGKVKPSGTIPDASKPKKKVK